MQVLTGGRGQWQLVLLGQDLQATVSHLTWVLGFELLFSVNSSTVSDLNPEPSLQLLSWLLNMASGGQNSGP